MNFLTLQYKLHTLFEWKKVPITKLGLFFRELPDWYSRDYEDETWYHTKSGSVFGKKDKKGNYYLYESWWR